MRYLVSRHPGTLEWFARQGLAIDKQVTHFDPQNIQPGDEVVGILPIQLAAQVCEKGGRYFHLQLDVPFELRGQELSAQQLDELGAQVVEYYVKRVLPADKSVEA